MTDTGKLLCTICHVRPKPRHTLYAKTADVVSVTVGDALLFSRASQSHPHMAYFSGSLSGPGWLLQVVFVCTAGPVGRRVVVILYSVLVGILSALRSIIIALLILLVVVVSANDSRRLTLEQYHRHIQGAASRSRASDAPVRACRLGPAVIDLQPTPDKDVDCLTRLPTLLL